MKIEETESQIPEHDKFISTLDYKKSMKKIDDRLKQANETTNDDVTDFAQKKYDEKLRKTNNNVGSNKTKHAEAEKN